MSEALSLGEPADEADWRALVEQGLKGAPWSRLVGKTADGISIEPLYRESNVRTASDEAGFPGAAPFVRGVRDGAWVIRQAYDHPDPERANRDILADLAGGVGGIELVLGDDGVAVRGAADLDLVLADVILEAAPVSLDGASLATATMLEAKLRGVAAAGTAFNLDPIGALMRTGVWSLPDMTDACGFAERLRGALPTSTSLRVDARPVHEAGGTEAQEIAGALSSGIAYLRALTSDDGLSAAEAASTLSFAIAVGPDVLVETAKLRALRLCWTRVMEASGAPPEARAAHIHAFTSRRTMTRYDAWTNVLRVTTAAFAAGIGGADAITTYPLTDALGLQTPFARRVARNTQNVLLEECRLGHVADPAGGAWFVESLTSDLADKAWTLMQDIEAKGGIVASLQAGHLQHMVVDARAARELAIATRRENITGVTDFPLLDAAMPEFEPRHVAPSPQNGIALAPMRLAGPFEAIRDRAEAKTPRAAVFFATIGTLAAFAPRAQFARNLFAIAGVGSIGAEDTHATADALVDAFRDSGARVAVIAGTDGAYAEHAENLAQRLKAGGAAWVLLAGRPGESEAKLRAAGVDQFVFTGIDAVKELQTLHAALGLAP